MGFSNQELAVWNQVGAHYDNENLCKDCGESFYSPHQPACIWSDDTACLNERVTCGDCLRPSCAGCV
jgi:hypothetical protein